MVSAEYPPALGGVGDHTARLTAELAAVGHHVEVVTSARNGSAAARHLVERWDWRILAALPRLAARRRWDVLHIQYQPGAYGLHPAINVLPWWLRLLPGRRPAVVTTFHDLRVPYIFPKAGPLREAAVRLLARRSDAAVAVADTDLSALRQWVLSAAAGTVVAHVPLGNHFDAAPPAGFDRAAWRRRLGVDPGSFVVGHFGFVNRSKGVAELVEATSLLVAAGRDVTLLMIGDQLGSSDPTNWAYSREVAAGVERLGLAKRVRWTGRQEPAAIVGYLRCADVAALPFTDGVSLRRTSAIAAWAHGVPVLTTAPLVQVPWLAGDDPPAATVPATRPDLLADALAALADDPPRRAALAAAGRRFASRFAWPEVTRRTLSVYAAVTG